MDMKTKNQRKQLTHSQLVLLGDYLKDNKELIESKTRQEAAESISAALGFEVSVSSVLGMAEIRGVKLKKRGPSTNPAERFQSIEDRMDKTENMIREIAKHIPGFQIDLLEE